MTIAILLIIFFVHLFSGIALLCYVGALLKSSAGQFMEEWLADEASFEQFFFSGKLSASERRVLIAHWYGGAFEAFSSPKFAEARARAFQVGITYQCAL